MALPTADPPIPLLCTVRGCGQLLQTQEDGKALVCARGHSFDLARAGYVNLLQPQDRRSSEAGDAPAIVAARARGLDRGWLDPFVETVRRQLEALGLPGNAAVVDAGCGEGRLVRQIVAGSSVRVAGVDLSVAAIRAAAAGSARETPPRAEDGPTGTPRFVWIVANADRMLPFPDESVDLCLSLFGRRNAGEFRRILRPAGFVLAALPGPDDLIELRERAQSRAVAVERAEKAADAFRDGFERLPTSEWRTRIELDRSGILDALRLTYRGERRRERERIEALESLEVTLSAESVLVRKR